MKKLKITKTKTSQTELKELSLLYKISSSMHTLDLNEILHLILKAVTKGIGFDRARLYIYDEEAQVLRLKMAVGLKLKKEESIDIVLPLEKDKSIVGRSFSKNKPYVIQDAQNDPHANKDIIKLFNVKSFAAVPLTAPDKVKGVVTADNLHSNRTISDNNLRSLVTFANHAGIAIENAEMYDKLKHFNIELERQVKLTTEKLLKAQDELISKERLAALGELSAGIAHEIRNPLTSIKILINALFTELPVNVKQGQDVAVINEEIERLNSIISQFLKFARPQEPVYEKLAIKDVIKSTLTLVKLKIKKQNISIQLDISSKLPKVKGDPNLLKQAFLNFMLNAIQAMPEGGNLIITASQTSRKTKSLDTLEIIFKDTGIGIAQKNIKMLFTPFYTTKEEGLGLGLSITQKIIAKHGGDIKIESTENAGTTLKVYIPIIQKR
ncbi:MAG: ATP-binding protein [Candidatus Ancaeobacter aquaticus]|nr:ATP-binding protein [Candidatus Ancaeobacter aquaticus]